MLIFEKKRIDRISKIAESVSVRIETAERLPIVSFKGVVLAPVRFRFNHIADKTVGCETIPFRLQKLHANEVLQNVIVLKFIAVRFLHIKTDPVALNLIVEYAGRVNIVEKQPLRVDVLTLLHESVIPNYGVLHSHDHAPVTLKAPWLPLISVPSMYML